MKPEFIIVKTWEESETWPYLQANQLGCHSFMDAGNRHKAPGPEVKRCFEESRTASNRSFLVSVVPFFSSPMEVTKSGLGGCCTPSGFVSQLRNPAIRELQSFIIDWKQTSTTFVPKRNIIFIILHRKQTCSLPWRGILVLSSKAAHYKTSFQILEMAICTTCHQHLCS